MGEKKLVPLRNGETIEIDFEGLEKLLSDGGEISKAAKLILKYHFPIESQLARHGQDFDRRRWQAWFDVKNTWLNRLEAEALARDPGKCFQITPQLLSENASRQLLAIASHSLQRDRKSNHRNRVSDFADWVFRLEHTSTKQGKAAGIVGEREVQKQRNRYGKPMAFDTDWQLWFEDDFAAEGGYFEITSLRVNGSPMFGKPDYVFINKKTRTALIVEVKTSDAKLLPDGWPNMRAQLWAYAQIDALRAEAMNVILIGEVWTLNNERVGRRKTYSWKMSDSRFRQENEALFQRYQQCATRCEV